MAAQKRSGPQTVSIIKKYSGHPDVFSSGGARYAQPVAGRSRTFTLAAVPRQALSAAQYASCQRQPGQSK